MYLIEENRVLKEQLESGGKRLRATDDQRCRLAVQGKPLGRKVLCQIATILTPDTILAWHRKLIAAADFFHGRGVDGARIGKALHVIRYRHCHPTSSHLRHHGDSDFRMDGTYGPKFDGL